MHIKRVNIETEIHYKQSGR